MPLVMQRRLFSSVSSSVRIAAEQARIREAEEAERIAAELALEAERKAKRDARYAARKARGGRMPPGFTVR